MNVDAADAAADVLQQPTRARLYDHLAGLDRPVSSDELAAELGLHASGVRVHLERLRVAGLVSRERMSQTLGRPRYGWQLASYVLPPREQADAYLTLARWLARTIPARTERLAEIDRAGRALGRELSPEGGQPAAQAMGRTLHGLGFAPRTELKDGGRVVFRLGNCPYREAVRESQAVICTLHRGMTRGLLDRLAPSARLARFIAEDPDRAGCRLEVDGLASH